MNNIMSIEQLNSILMSSQWEKTVEFHLDQSLCSPDLIGGWFYKTAKIGNIEIKSNIMSTITRSGSMNLHYDPLLPIIEIKNLHARFDDGDIMQPLEIYDYIPDTLKKPSTKEGELAIINFLKSRPKP